MSVLTLVHGIGPQKSAELERIGIHTINDLRNVSRENPDILNQTQHTGLRYFDDLQKPIHRQEMVKWSGKLRGIVKSVLPNSLSGLVGSFARGSDHSGDIDLMISTNSVNNNSLNGVINLIIERLSDENILRDDFDVLSRGRVTSMLVVKLPGHKIYRRLDIFVVTKKQFPFAYLEKVSGIEYNIYLRRKARNMGYKLHKDGINTINSNRPINQLQIMSRIGKHTFVSEKDIFDFLGEEYKPPKNR